MYIKPYQKWNPSPVVYAHHEAGICSFINITPTKLMFIYDLYVKKNSQKLDKFYDSDKNPHCFKEDEIRPIQFHTKSGY